MVQAAHPTAPARGGARKSRAAKAGDWLDTTRQAWEQTANLALEQAGRAERIDGRSLADRRDAAERDGDLERAAELSREPHIHLGPSRHRAGSGAAAREKASAGAARGASERGARRRAGHRPPAGGARGAGDRRSRSAAAGEPMTEFEERLTHEYSKAGRAIRAGAAASEQVARSWQSRCGTWPISRTPISSGISRGARPLGEQVEHLGTQVQRLADQSASDQQGYVKWSKYMSEQQGILNAHVEKVTKAYNELARFWTRADGGARRGGTSRPRPHGLPDRVQGLIDNLIARSRDRGGPSR